MVRTGGVGAILVHPPATGGTSGKVGNRASLQIGGIGAAHAGRRMARTRVAWTAAERDALRVAWADPDWTKAQIATTLRRTEASVSAMACALGLGDKALYSRATTAQVVAWARLHTPAAKTLEDVQHGRRALGLPPFVVMRRAA